MGKNTTSCYIPTAVDMKTKAISRCVGVLVILLFPCPLSSFYIWQYGFEFSLHSHTTVVPGFVPMVTMPEMTGTLSLKDRQHIDRLPSTISIWRPKTCFLAGHTMSTLTTIVKRGVSDGMALSNRVWDREV